MTLTRKLIFTPGDGLTYVCLVALTRVWYYRILMTCQDEDNKMQEAGFDTYVDSYVNMLNRYGLCFAVDACG